MPIIFSEPKKQFYISNLISISTLTSLFFLVISFVITFIIVDLSSDFFIKTSIYSINPVLTFDDQILLSIEDEEDTTHYYSTIIKFNDGYSSLVNIPLVKSEKTDNDLNGVYEKYNVNIKVPIKARTVRNVNIGLLHKYSFVYNSYTFSYESMSSLYINTPYGVSYIKSIGDVLFTQKAPVSSGRVKLGNTINDVTETSTSSLYIQDYEDLYKNNIYGSKYKYSYYTLPYRSSSEIEIDIEISIPTKQDVLFESSYLFIAKFAWIQFVCVYVPVFIVLYLLLFFMFQSKILKSIEK